MRAFTRDDLDGQVRFGAGGVLYTGREPLSVEGLPTRAAGVESGRASEAPDEANIRVYSGGGFSVRVKPASGEEFYDHVSLVGPGERELGFLSFITVDSRRWPLRRESFADVLPSGERFLIASVAREEGTPFGSFRRPSGPAQVWCSPREMPLPLFPEVPPPPAVMEAGGLTEVSLAGVPLHYEAIAPTRDGSVYVMAREQEDPYSAPSGPFTLWRLGPVSPEAERLEPLPESGGWYRLATAPDDGSLWALGKEALAHREADGRWTVHTLPGGAGTMFDFLALPGGRAVVLRGFFDAQRPVQYLVQFAIAGPGPGLEVTEHPSSGEPRPLVPLPDGFLFPGSRPAAYATSGVSVPGFRFREGKRFEEDALLAQVRELQLRSSWLRQGRVLLLAESSTAAYWVELDARTGEVLKRQTLEERLRTPGSAGLVGEPDTGPAPKLPGYELPRWVDHQGRFLAMPRRSIPAWLQVGNAVEETASTPKGTWLRLKGDVLLFWDGTRLSAYFHPKTRQYGLRFSR
ncbi:hypothetical protein ACN28I_26780 [Archangium gephyra]|uniref:hypothetical protein n=1 Tax=Archangium gephyra TaxID=48 RepID=UPI003B77FAE9